LRVRRFPCPPPLLSTKERNCKCQSGKGASTFLFAFIKSVCLEFYEKIEVKVINNNTRAQKTLPTLSSCIVGTKLCLAPFALASDFHHAKFQGESHTFIFSFDVSWDSSLA